MLDDLAANPQTTGQTFTFTMDNLNVHNHPLIINMIRGAGHRLVFRAPYWPVDGAVEYAFDTIQTRLKSFVDQLTAMQDLDNRINLMIGAIPNFTHYFIYVGFPP